MQIQMAVFDMAGTTVNENNLVYKTLHRAINEAGYRVSLSTVLLHGAGKAKLQALLDIMNIVTGGYMNQPVNSIYDRFTILLNEAYSSADIQPFKGVEEVFEWMRLRGIKVILNTGYQKEIAFFILQQLNWFPGKQIDDVITASDVKQSRPHPDMIHLAMQRFNTSEASAVIKIGDSVTDIEEGRNAGCGLSIGITTGAHSYDQLMSAQPDYIINEMEELPLLLQKVYANTGSRTIL